MIQIENLKTKKYKEKSGKKEETSCVTKKNTSDMYYQHLKNTQIGKKNFE